MAGRPIALSHDLAGTAQDVVFGFGYTPASQIAQQTRSNDSYVWTGHVANSVAIDRAYATNGLNQYTNAGAIAFAYDGNGNLTSEGVTSYAYDIENRLINATGTKNVALRYDPLGRLYETIGGTTTRLLYDGDELIAEYDGSGTLLRRYEHGKSVDDPVVWYEGNGNSNPRWLHSNHQGSVIAVSDSTGAAIAINSYDEYGIPASSLAGQNLYGRFGYTGQAWIPELGMYHYKARIYSPTLGRFLQTDPIGYEDQINMYAYAGNDPISRIDPTGLADLNLFDVNDYWNSAATAFEPGNEQPRIFTIMGHASDKGMHDQRGGKDIVISRERMLEMAKEKGYNDGDYILITGCNCGQGYAQELADISGAMVIAGSGYVSVDYKKGKSPYVVGDDVTLFTFSGLGRTGQQGDFWAFSKGKDPAKLGQSVFFDSDTGAIGFNFKQSPPGDDGLFKGKKGPFCHKSARSEDCE